MDAKRKYELMELVLKEIIKDKFFRKIDDTKRSIGNVVNKQEFITAKVKPKELIDLFYSLLDESYEEMKKTR